MDEGTPHVTTIDWAILRESYEKSEDGKDDTVSENTEDCGFDAWVQVLVV
jgi:hypothetical protein